MIDYIINAVAAAFNIATARAPNINRGIINKCRIIAAACILYNFNHQQNNSLVVRADQPVHCKSYSSSIITKSTVL